MIRIVVDIKEREDGLLQVVQTSYKIDEETDIEQIIANILIDPIDRIIKSVMTT